MNTLARIPFSGWFILVTLICYAIWNPSGYSIYHLWMGSPLMTKIFLKLTVTFILLAILFFFLVTTLKTVGKLGVFLYIVFLGLLLGLLHEMGLLGKIDLRIAQYLAQPVIALMLTIGLLFNKFRFAVTGIRTVDEPDIDE